MSAARSFPGLGFDPAPGELDALEVLALSLRRTAERLAEARRLLASAGRSYGAWTGEAAEEFARRIAELSSYIERAGRSYGDVGRAVAAFAGCVEDLQAEARLVERDACDARHRVEAAAGDPRIAWAGLTEAQEDLRRALARARSVADRHEVAAARVVAALEAAGDLAPAASTSGPGPAARLTEAVVGVARSVWAAYDGLVARCAPAITVLADSCGALAAGLGLLSLVPGLQILAVPGAALGGAALLAHLVLAVTDEGGWADVALDAAGVASFGVGLRLAAGAASAERAAATARSTLHQARRVEALARDTGPRVARAAVRIRAETFAAMTAAEQRALGRGAALMQHRLADATLSAGGLAGLGTSFPERRPTYRRGAGQLRQLVGRGLDAYPRLDPSARQVGHKPETLR